MNYRVNTELYRYVLTYHKYDRHSQILYIRRLIPNFCLIILVTLMNSLFWLFVSKIALFFTLKKICGGTFFKSYHPFISVLLILISISAVTCCSFFLSFLFQLICGPILNAFRCVSTIYMCGHVFLYEETFAAPESKIHQMKIVD